MIKYYKPSIGDEEKKAVERVLESGWLTTGSEVKVFEEEFAKAHGCKYALAVNSATSGLMLAIGCSPYIQATLPNYTFIATFQAAYREGKAIRLRGTPAEMVEDGIILGDGYNMSIDDMGTIIPVHIGGELCDMSRIGSSKQFIVEDCAHRFPGGDYKRGVIQVFSFYANKPITCGEGGMVCTDSQDYYERMKEVYYHGMDKTRFERGQSEYTITKIGYKYNMSDIHAAIGREQLKKMPYLKQRRQEIAGKYIEAFTGTPIKTRPSNPENSWHLFMIDCGSSEFADKVRARLTENDIEYSRHYQPLTTFEPVKEYASWTDDMHRADTLRYRRSISLPIYPDLTDEEQRAVIDCIKGAL